MRAALLGLALIACGGAPPEPARGAGVAAIELGVQTNTPAAPLPAHTLWSGRYECAQGVTGLTLTLDVEPDGRAGAVFDFGPTPQNPTLPTGRYLVVGRADLAGDGGTLLTLAPDRWIAQPPGYVMVGLGAAIDPAGRSMQGHVDHPSCGALALTRVQ